MGLKPVPNAPHMPLIFNKGTTMFASQGFRLTALFATLLMAFSLVAVDTAEARRGGSFGSRGFRTQQVIPATPVAPKATAPVQRTTTDSATQRSNSVGTASTPARPTLFGGFGGALIGGLLFSGMFGLLFGYGFGGFGGMLALLVQLILVAVVINLLFRRRRPAMAGGGPGASRYEMPNFGSGSQRTGAAPRSGASRRAGARDQIGITDTDLSAFEARLGELQDAFSREDDAALRHIATPEVAGYLAEELAGNASRGLRNEVFDVKLLSGDVAEAWREGATEFATVAMRYESRDITRNRASGDIVSGEDSVTVTTEIWTFRRQNRGPWQVSAIQEA